MSDGSPKLCLPERTAALVTKLNCVPRHPGLLLDKFSPPGDQAAQKAALKRVVRCGGDRELLKRLRERRDEALKGLAALSSWSATTAAPLTLHLSHASALENAGICLHPLYGFVYLPGSGLKGMARAYAETIWLTTQPIEQRAAASATLERVFGRAPKGTIAGNAGSVVFHDAWPERWPPLIVDIVNNHHKKYYEGEGEDAPGDWEDPEPSYFLAVKPGVTFSFALSLRRATAAADVTLAKEWLIGALCHLGAGAKTAAGYGGFRMAGTEAPPLPEGARAPFETPLELVTPAFLAGAGQEEEDCDLRPATLRGLLRWWWRTMHAAHLSVADLRRLEAAVWGNTEAGSPIKVEVEAIEVAEPCKFNFKNDSQPWEDFKKRHDLQTPPNQKTTQKTTQGLFYASYGMDEKVKEVVGGKEIKRPRQRWFVPPGAKWQLRILARDGRLPSAATKHEKSLIVPRDQVLGQARAALWLLCRYGGVGSKARKGFGCFQSLDFMSLDDCKQAADRCRAACGLASVPVTAADGVQSPALESMIPVQEVGLGVSDPWQATHEVGAALQSFVKSLPKKERMALGLPRGGLIGPRGPRYASPLHLHIDCTREQTLRLSGAAFPSSYPPDGKRNRKILELCVNHFGDTFHPKEKKYKRAPNELFAKGERIRTPEGEIATTVEAVLIGQKMMWVQVYGETDLEHISVAGCTSLDHP